MWVERIKKHKLRKLGIVNVNYNLIKEKIIANTYSAILEKIQTEVEDMTWKFQGY